MRKCDGTCDTCRCEIWSPYYLINKRARIELRAILHRLSAIFQHVQQCTECQRIVKVGLSSRAALSSYLLWHAGVAEEGNSQDEQQQ